MRSAVSLAVRIGCEMLRISQTVSTQPTNSSAALKSIRAIRAEPLSPAMPSPAASIAWRCDAAMPATASNSLITEARSPTWIGASEYDAMTT